MPEGPSIIILKDEVQAFKGKKVLVASGNTTIEKERMNGQKIIDLKSWGKHFLICFKGFTLRIHLMLFGSYRINERKKGNPRLTLQFADGELNFYACSVKLLDEPLSELYDWRVDIMSDGWDPAEVKRRLKAVPEMPVCDALLDQRIFSGSGNIVKNEVLFRTYIHPASLVGSLPARQLNLLIQETRNYGFDFLLWKLAYMLKREWLIIGKKKCPRCNVPVFKEYMGRTRRRTFFCNNCQVLYK